MKTTITYFMKEDVSKTLLWERRSDAFPSHYSTALNGHQSHPCNKVTRYTLYILYLFYNK